MSTSSNAAYSRFLVRHHWFTVSAVVFVAVALTILGFVFTRLPDFSDPRKGWGARGKGTIFSQLMVLRHASERFRLAYELPLETYELFERVEQFSNVTIEQLDELSYQSDALAKYDLWRKGTDELIEYENLDDSFYNVDREDQDSPDYEDNSESVWNYQWHRDRHFDIHNRITKYIDDKMINITVLDFVRTLPQFDRRSYQSARLPFDLFRPYAYLIEEKYRGRTGRDGMIEFYVERSHANDDLLSLDHLRSICSWEKKFKHMLTLDSMPSLSLATFVALYSSKTDCQSITANDIEHFRSVLQTCLPYYIDGYMDIPFSDIFLNRVVLEHQPGLFTHQEQNKAVYTALRHTCFYKNITRFIFDHFVDKPFLNALQQSNARPKVSISMIYVSNYQAMVYNRTRDQTMCLRRQPHSRKYCEERGCQDDYRNQFITEECAKPGAPLGNCEEYCRCKYRCSNETEQVVAMVPVLKEKQFVELFGKYFASQRRLAAYKDEFVHLIALNFANVRERAAMVRVHEDMLLILIATGLIIGITLLYLRSITIALIIVFAAGLSTGVSYFIYRVIYGIPIFPFMNLMSIFLLIGIGCDDIFVFFDTWEQEKSEWLRKYLDRQANDNANVPLNEMTSSNKKVKPSIMRSPSNAFQTRPGECEFPDGDERRRLLSSEKALTDIMSQTLKHAASSMFVTSFTTSAAFFTNMLTNISFVQVFGVFTGTCILLYFFITVTAIAAFAVIYEKYIENITTRLPLIRLLSSSSSDASTNLCRRFAMLCRNIRIRVFTHFIPRMIIQCRYVLVLVLFTFGIFGLLGVFYYPKLQVPSTQKVAFFTRDNPMEAYEFSMKTSFNGYMKEEKRMFAYPSVSFIFGIRDIDDGYIFDMSDRGHLHLMPLHLERRQTMEFFKTFISDLGTRTDLFSSNYDLEKDFEAFYQLTTEHILKSRILDDRAKLNMSKTDHLAMIQYLRNLNITLIDHLLLATVRTLNYTVENDQSDRIDYMERKNSRVNRTIYRISAKQVKAQGTPVIDYSNYRKLFNKTLAKFYKEQIQRRFDSNEIRSALRDGELRDALTKEYQGLALTTAMQCLTGAAGANNVPADFCQQQLKKQRSVNWAVLPDKPSSDGGSVRPFAVIISIRGTLNRTDYDSYNAYYFKVKNFFDPYIQQHAPAHLKHSWFSSPGFAFYGVQRELLVGSYTSLIASLGIALCILFLTSGNLFIAFYALITITFAIATSVAIFAALKWELGIVEAIIVIMSVGLAVDFVVHFGVGYINANADEEEDDDQNGDRKKVPDIPSERAGCFWSALQQTEREGRVRESVSRVGSAVFMAAFTTFAAGFSMTLSSLTAFRQMGQFLMTIMFTSWMFATFFFLPLCAIVGPVGKCGSIPFSRMVRGFRRCCRRAGPRSGKDIRG